MARDEKWQRLYTQLMRMDGNGAAGTGRCATSVVRRPSARLGEDLVLALRRFSSTDRGGRHRQGARFSRSPRRDAAVRALDEGVGSAGIAYELAQLLTQWEDDQVGPLLRRSIEAWRDAGSTATCARWCACFTEWKARRAAGFIVATISEAPAETQLSVLTEVLAKLPADDAVRAVRDLAETTQVPEVRSGRSRSPTPGWSRPFPWRSQCDHDPPICQGTLSAP